MFRQIIQNSVKKHLGFFLFAAALFVAMFTYDDYGLTWDEPIQRQTGIISYDYAFSGDTTLLTWKDKDYGVAFELPLILLENAFNLEDSRDIFLMRHFVTHCFFLIGCYFLFLLIDHLYRNKLLATVGFFLLLLHPRIYAHSFFNTKDIPFLAMYIICFYYFVKAFDKRTLWSFVILGICAGLLINLRIMGILLLLGVLLILIVDIFRTIEKRKQLQLIIAFLISSLLILYITWPFLWNDPVNNFITAFTNMSKFRWDGVVLFNGEFMASTALSWYYMPEWFSITTPIIYLLLGVFGIFLIIFQFIKKPLSFLPNSLERSNLLFLGYFLAPIIAVIVLHSVLYDGWRQMFFVYPPFVLICIYGLSKMKEISIKTYKISGILLVLGFSFTGWNMIKNAPFQNTYFNEVFLFSSDEFLRKNYEMDYWGASYKQSLEYILKVDSSPKIYISVENYPGTINLDILPPQDRKRFEIAPIENANYFITNYRWHAGEYIWLENSKFHQIKVGNNTINEIFKLK